MKIGEKSYELNALITRVIDGDTVEATVDCLFDIHIDQTLRLFGINMPEIHSKVETERKAAEAAKARLKDLVEGKIIKIMSYKEKEKYGRYLAELIVDGVNVNELLIKEGLAKAYFGGTKSVLYKGL
jgi:micrococcal nuclease